MRLHRLPLTILFILTATALPQLSSSAQEAGTKSQTVKVLGKGELKIPAEFKTAQTASRIIEHEFQVSEGDQTARLTMMAAGGGIEPNIKRWKGQFSEGNKDAIKTEEIKVGDWNVHIIDVNGTFARSMGGGPFAPGKIVQEKDYAMAGAILKEPGGERLYFLKMIGPAKVVGANRERFVKMVKSIAK